MYNSVQEQIEFIRLHRHHLDGYDLKPAFQKAYLKEYKEQYGVRTDQNNRPKYTGINNLNIVPDFNKTINTNWKELKDALSSAGIELNDFFIIQRHYHFLKSIYDNNTEKNTFNIGSEIGNHEIIFFLLCMEDTTHPDDHTITGEIMDMNDIKPRTEKFNIHIRGGITIKRNKNGNVYLSKHAHRITDLKEIMRRL